MPPPNVSDTPRLTSESVQEVCGVLSLPVGDLARSNL